MNWLGHISECLNRWEGDKGSFDSNLIDYLMLDSLEDFHKMVRYLRETVDIDDFASWLVENFGNLSERNRQKAVRRFVAIALSDSIAGKELDDSKAHSNPQKCSEWLKYFSDLSEFDLPSSPNHKVFSPAFRSVMHPFLNHLESVENAEIGGRSNFESDDGLSHSQKINS